MENPESRSLSKVVKGNNVVAIVNRGDEDVITPLVHWKWIEAKLAEVYKQIFEEMPGSPPLVTRLR